MDSPDLITTQTAIIGCGLTGMAAALFGAENSVNSVVVGSAGASDFSSGLLDLFGVLPSKSPHICSRPWEAIEQLPDFLPHHPYTRISKADIAQALDLFMSELREQGLTYSGEGDSNVLAIGPLGTLKPTYRLPATMLAGVRERIQGSPGLIVDFHGLKDFSARLVASNLERVWPGLRTARLTFPGTESRAEVFTELLAHSLESAQIRDQLAQSLKPLISEVQVLGLPAVLGMGSAQDIHRELEERLQIRIFEIPTLPASVPGLRLKGALKRAADASPLIQTLDQAQVTAIDQDLEGWFHITVQGPMNQLILKSRTVLLATGRFLGHGLTADKSRISESLFNLPVSQPESRSGWHREDFFDPQGHPVNQAGLEVNDLFQPIDSNAQPVYANLYAAGSILAHHDWTRTKSGSGVAVATAFRAMKAIHDRLGA